jgi:hypothetical protein
MPDPTHAPDGPTPASAPRMPRWVKWPAIVIAVLILLFVVLQLLGIGGKHGPGRHGFSQEMHNSLTAAVLVQTGTSGPYGGALSR